MSDTIRISPYHKTTVDLDGRALRIRIARFSVDDLGEYSKLEAAMSQRREDRVLLVRRTPEELERITPTDTQADEHGQLLETAKALEARAVDAKKDDFITEVFGFLRSVVARLTPVDHYRIPDDEIRRRRDQDLTPDQRAQLAVYRDEEQAAADAFMQFVIGKFVTVEAGQIEIDTEVPQPDGAPPVIVTKALTTGAELLEYFGSRIDLLRSLMRAVRNENFMTEAEKNASRSRSGSTRSSGERGQVAGGPTPDAAAMPVEREPSAKSAAATASIAEVPSGAMAATSS